ncbi:hypothetical protein [Plantibacter cousiniae (nom. nud.)]|uniref:hypothetical protein n=1 Tax=Plantibacter cousiniae (nom. nud.) TaxID=199709 RepID=UPI0009A72FB5|nr:hypothetical protein [Plantibacter cousiniae]
MAERIHGVQSTAQIPRHLYDRQVKPSGSFFIGNPEEIAERILTVHTQLHPDRLGFENDWGRTPHRDLLLHIELLGTVVKPAIDRELGLTCGHAGQSIPKPSRVCRG